MYPMAWSCGWSRELLVCFLRSCILRSVR
jgi:hypothetical protein